MRRDRDAVGLSIAVRIAALAGVLTMAGCAVTVAHGADAAGATSLVATAPQPNASPSAGLRVTYAGPITAPVTYHDAGISLMVPAADDTALVSWQTLASACTTGDAICADQPGTVTLGRATSALTGTAGVESSQSSTDALTPLMNHTLVYVLQWSAVPCAPSGGPALAPSPRPVRTSTASCRLIDFFDADTGKVLLTVESPEP